MRYPTREYQRDSPSDLLLRRPQGIKPKKKIVKIRDSGLTRKVISALMENHIDAYLLVRTTFHGRSSSIRLEGYSGSTLRIWRRYASGSMSFRRQVPISPYNSALRSPPKNIKFLFPRQMAQRAFSAALCLPPPDRQHCNNRVRPTDSVHS
ncbi:Uncharacterised protein [Escherichia coli]|nr:Uncharacterised protein [Escherichia coli]STK50568.1 Uncharacterised protein [Escherichia coli]